MLVFLNGVISGTDLFGSLFDGEYEFDPNAGQYLGKISVSVPPHVELVQGLNSGPSGLKYEIDLVLPSNFDDDEYVTMKTPVGPLNVKLIRLRSLDV